MQVGFAMLQKGADKWIFVFTDETRLAALRQLSVFAADPELDFSWYDAAVVSKRIRDMPKCEKKDVR